MTRHGLLWVALVLGSAVVDSGSAIALGLFEKNHPTVEQGRKAYEKGDYAEALRQFDAAAKELSGSASLEFNRGNALFKLGRMEEANQAYHHALETPRGDLKEKDYYNLGNVWAQMGNTKEALAAYRRALTLDPTDEEARHNLEVMLRDLDTPKPPPDGGTSAERDGGSDGGSPDGGGDGGSSDGGSGQGSSRGTAPDGGQDGGSGDGGGSNPDGGTGPQNPAHSNRSDGGSQPPEEQDAGEAPRRDGGEQEAEELLPDGGSMQVLKLDTQDVERLLDSMKQDEKNLQLWRFQQKKPRRENEKDW